MYFEKHGYNEKMEKSENIFLNTRPELCHMCGKCCRVVTTSVPYSELKEKADEGDEGAMDFLELFEPYPSIDAAREVDAGIVDNIIERLKSDNNFNPDEITFYGCRFLLDNNLCSRYETRKTLCKHCPSSPWAITPPGCGYEGWLFLKREEIKHKIRKSKEELLELQVLKNKVTNEETLKKIEAVEKKIVTNIEAYRNRGSENW